MLMLLMAATRASACRAARYTMPRAAQPAFRDMPADISHTLLQITLLMTYADALLPILLMPFAAPLLRFAAAFSPHAADFRAIFAMLMLSLRLLRAFVAADYAFPLFVAAACC